MPTPNTTAEAFRELDFHDDTFVGLRVLPAVERGEAFNSTVEIHLQRDSEPASNVLCFSGCTNLRVALDFDVLAHNLPPNTSRVDAHTNLNRMRDLMQMQKKDWGVEYAGTSKSPLVEKLAALDQLVCFHVQFLGGVIEIIAREYSVEPANQSLQANPR